MRDQLTYWKSCLIVAVCLVMCGMLSSCGISRKAQLPRHASGELHRIHPRLTDFQLDSLKAICGYNKIFVDEFLEPTLIALSHYPELIDTEIEFKYSSEATTMAARPKPLSMFASRKYVVLINDRGDFEGIHLSDVPFNAQIGVIGHELAHVADYENHNLFGVVGILMRYSSKHHKPLFEREIDKATIERGLGWQLLDWASFSMSDASGSSGEYREFKRQHYLSVHEIEEYINLYSRYGAIDN